MRHFLFTILIASCSITAQSQDIYPDWPFDSNDEFATATISPDFEKDGIYYAIIPGRDKEVAVMNKHSLSIMRQAELSLYLSALDWNVADTYEGNVIIPEKVAYNNTDYTVTMVMYGAFAKSTGLVSVEFPETIDLIRGGIFGGCTSLCKVKFPSSLDSMPKWTFAGCSSLKSIDLTKHAYNSGFVYSGCFGIEEATTSGKESELEALSERFDTWESIGQRPQSNGSLKRIYITDADAWQNNFEGSFTDWELAHATLFVPVGSRNAFAESHAWGQFADIQEKDNSGINLIYKSDELPKIHATGHTITSDNLAEIARIFDTTGRIVGTLSPSCPSSDPLNPGIYIVRSDNFSCKISVGI